MIIRLPLYLTGLVRRLTDSNLQYCSSSGRSPPQAAQSAAPKPWLSNTLPPFSAGFA